MTPELEKAYEELADACRSAPNSVTRDAVDKVDRLRLTSIDVALKAVDNAVYQALRDFSDGGEPMRAVWAMRSVAVAMGELARAVAKAPR